MNWVLGIDTSSTDLGIGLFRDAQPVASYARFLKNSHAEHIAQAVTAVLEGNGVGGDDITHIAIDVGPGSFTGLRIGLAFVKGFCCNTGIKVLPLSSLRVLAHAVFPGKGNVTAAIDARRDEVFWARFTLNDNSLERETGDVLSRAEEFKDRLQPGEPVVTDTMGYAASTVFHCLAGRPEVYPVERCPLQRGLVCAALGAARLNDERSWENASDVLPKYLRSFTPKGREA
jgi:tRNA threonylcarbamoyladenosine biosynthesis protein TsaB